MKIAASVTSLLFPSGCIHCESALPDALKLLCGSCLSLLEWIDPRERCSLCFAPLSARMCESCQGKITHFERLGCCFDYEGPAKDLIAHLKYRDQPYLAKSLASFMLLQHHRLEWPLPDLVTYIPQVFLRKCLRGYNQSALLAKNLAELMQRPIAKALKARISTLPQARLTREERMLLSPETFQTNGSICLEGKRVLLIDDVFTTGSTIECASRKLKESGVSELDVLCLLRA